jgi:ribulose-phosphate 3-epimerase
MSLWESLAGDRLLVDASLWSGDLACLRESIRQVDSFVDLYHFDVSDAHFVPGLLFFPDLVAALRSLTRKPFHAHLMVTEPRSLVDDFAQAGADIITVHVDTGPAAMRAVERILEVGAHAGLGFGLDGPIEGLLPYLDKVELVLLMGTPMGVKGQGLSPLAIPRIQEMRRLLAAHGLTGKVKIEADGGLRSHTVPALRSAGADLISPGSLVFKSDDLAQTFAWLHALPLPS